jgi:hypothetical protein
MYLRRAAILLERDHPETWSKISNNKRNIVGDVVLKFLEDSREIRLGDEELSIAGSRVRTLNYVAIVSFILSIAINLVAAFGSQSL